MITIRDYQQSDFAQLLAMGYEMWKAAPEFRGFTFDAERLIPISEACLCNDDMHCFVAVRDGRPVGFFVGGVTEFFFSSDRYAFDLALFVSPDRRGTSAAIRLMAAATEWARARGAKQLRFGAATGIDPERTERFFGGLGFAKAGQLYTFAVA
jgi:GNAT superfamily N-acetyltransferase